VQWIWTSFLCKVIFSRQIFLLYFGRKNFGGKKITLQKSEFTLQRRFFQLILGNVLILRVLMKFKRGYYHFRVTQKHLIFIIFSLWVGIFLHSIKMVIAPFEFHQYTYRSRGRGVWTLWQNLTLQKAFVGFCVTKGEGVQKSQFSHYIKNGST
jgi:hypothetical protein